ncbi:MAG: acyl carrier protein [Christensenellaceae bacterium]|nr:acyl carrier protein [Christensenellaceae bacterium]
MFEKICEIINEKMDIDVSEISKDSTFESLDIDSLDMVEIIMDLEEAFDVELEDAQDLKTISDLMDFIEKKQAEK